MKNIPLLINLSPQDYKSLQKESSRLGLSKVAFIRLLLRQWSDGITFTKDKNNNHKGRD